MSIPVISLQTHDWALDDEMVEYDALLSVTRIDQIENTIISALSDLTIKESLMKNSKKFLDNYLENKGTASKKLAEYLNKLNTETIKND